MDAKLLEDVRSMTKVRPVLLSDVTSSLRGGMNATWSLASGRRWKLNDQQLKAELRGAGFYFASITHGAGSAVYVFEAPFDTVVTGRGATVAVRSYR